MAVPAVAALLAAAAAGTASAAPSASASPSGHVIDTVVGTGDPGNSGDGGPAKHAALYSPGAVATAPDGTLYLVSGLTIRAVDPKTGTIRTVAGRNKSGFSGDGGPATKATFGTSSQQTLYGLSGITVGPDGTLYIADAANHRVRAVDPDKGTIDTVAGRGAGKDDRHFTGDGGPATKATLHYPRDVAVGKDGTLYINDAQNYRVRAVDPKTKRIRTVAGMRHPGDDGSGFFPRPDSDGTKATNTFVEASAIAVGDDGLLYLAQDEEDRIRVVDTEKDTIKTIAGRGSPSSYLDNPTDLAVAGGVLYIAAHDVFAVDQGKNHVYAFDLKRKRLTEFAGGAKGSALGDGGDPKDATFGGPDSSGTMAVAAGRDGVVYVSDSANNRVRAVRKGDPGTRKTGHRLSGKPITTLLGSGKKWTEQTLEQKDDEEGGTFYRDVHALDEVDLASPESIVVDRDGTIYVADTDNNRIRVVEPDDDRVRTLAGSQELPDYDDDEYNDGEKATDAFLHHPHGLVLGPDRRLYFLDNDTSEARIRYVDLEKGVVDTVPGSRNEFDEPADLTIDRKGTLYVADTGNDRVCRMKPSANDCSAVVGTSEDEPRGAIFQPGSIALDGNTLYIADSATFRVRAHDLKTGATRTVAGLYTRIGLAGDGGPGTSALLGPSIGLDVGPDGTLYLADAANHRVRALDPRSGVITTVVGNGSPETDPAPVAAGTNYEGGAFAGDGGPAGKAKLNSPDDVEVGPDGALYVVDTGNNRIRAVGDVDVSARGGTSLLTVVIPLLALAALTAAGYLFLRRRRPKGTTAGGHS